MGKKCSPDKDTAIFAKSLKDWDARRKELKKRQRPTPSHKIKKRQVFERIFINSPAMQNDTISG